MPNESFNNIINDYEVANFIGGGMGDENFQQNISATITLPIKILSRLFAFFRPNPSTDKNQKRASPLTFRLIYFFPKLKQ